MTAQGRDLAGFARAVEALAPWLDRLVFIGGWAHYLHTLQPDAAPVGFAPLTTDDADVAAPLDLKAGAQTIPDRLVAAGFRQELKTDEVPPVSEYVLGDEDSGFYLEFLAPLVGGAVRRDGSRNVTGKVAGVTVQKLRYLEILLIAPRRFTLTRALGFPVPHPIAISVASPAAYVVQKVLALPKRDIANVPKDLLYVHDTFAIFADAYAGIAGDWNALRAQMLPAHVHQFEKIARGHIEAVTDPLRAAARIASARPNPPTPDILLAGLRHGFAAAFELKAREG